MKYDAMGLLLKAASTMRKGDAGDAYALLEMANNLRLLMRREASLDEWLACYTGHDAAPIDIDKLLPVKP